jgi:Fe-S cluster assembly iron-binding protein IscA
MQTLEINIKEEAKRLIDELPDNSTWEDLMYRIYVRKAVESGLQDSREGRIISHAEVRKRFGLGE